ncbi:MAG: L-ribulose-5-phosphate 4-epimerase [Ruminococcaceae bacterium]|nr:L-ribulose-5-phosphate 4-epimerase [Oscillospiraceae bacterium]
MLEDIKQRVWEANLSLVTNQLVTLTWGNVSEKDPETGYVVIKPSGVNYDKMVPSNMVIVDLAGNKIEGDLNPSSDTPTHLELYRRFPAIGGITHTHSRFATAFAQSQREIPALGTTHADGFYGAVPCTRSMTDEEIATDYETNTGKVIAELFSGDTILQIPAALVASHGPFTWGSNAKKSVENAVILEEVAATAWHTLLLTPDAQLSQALLDRHYLRKHGKHAYYGQMGGDHR